MLDRRPLGAVLGAVFLAWSAGCASSRGEAQDPSAPAGAKTQPQSLFDSVRPTRHDPRATDSSDLRRDVRSDATLLASLPSGRGTDGKLLIFRSISGHVPLKDRAGAGSRSAAEREAARAAEIEAELEAERNRGVLLRDVPPEEAHYFELTALASELPACSNVHLDATEHEGQLVFLHAVKPGPANQSYGLQVAALAGVPPNVIKRAKTYLKALESQQTVNADHPQAQLALEVADEEPDRLRESVDSIDPDSLTPREALAALYKLKDL